MVGQDRQAPEVRHGFAVVCWINGLQFNFGEASWDAQSGQPKIIAACTVHLRLAARSQQLAALKSSGLPPILSTTTKTGRAQVRVSRKRDGTMLQVPCTRCKQP